VVSEFVPMLPQFCTSATLSTYLLGRTLAALLRGAGAGLLLYHCLSLLLLYRRQPFKASAGSIAQYIQQR
jgi:hypothetical protein